MSQKQQPTLASPMFSRLLMAGIVLFGAGSAYVVLQSEDNAGTSKIAAALVPPPKPIERPSPVASKPVLPVASAAAVSALLVSGSTGATTPVGAPASTVGAVPVAAAIPASMPASDAANVASATHTASIAVSAATTGASAVSVSEVRPILPVAAAPAQPIASKPIAQPPAIASGNVRPVNPVPTPLPSPALPKNIALPPVTPAVPMIPQATQQSSVKAEAGPIVSKAPSTAVSTAVKTVTVADTASHPAQDIAPRITAESNATSTPVLKHKKRIKRVMPAPAAEDDIIVTPDGAYPRGANKPPSLPNAPKTPEKIEAQAVKESVHPSPVATVTVKDSTSEPVVKAATAAPLIPASTKPSVLVANGDKAWVRIDETRTVIVNKGQEIKGLGVFHGGDGKSAKFDAGVVPVSQ